MSVQDNQCVHCPELKMWPILTKEIETLKQEIKKNTKQINQMYKKKSTSYTYTQSVLHVVFAVSVNVGLVYVEVPNASREAQIDNLLQNMGLCFCMAVT